MSKKKIGIALVAALSTSACVTGEMGMKQGAGTLLGGVAGGVIGSQFGGGTGKLVATGVGTLLGAFLGSEIGSSLDKADRTAIDRAGYQAYNAPIGQRISWNNPRSGNHGYVQPVREGYTGQGQYCREFVTTAYVGGKMQQVAGQACQMPDGSWRMVDNR